jgi:hypothetical protein
MTQTWSNKEQLFPGLWVYRDVVKPELKLIERLLAIVEKSNGHYNWRGATVGYDETRPSYRDCQDIKIGPIPNPKNEYDEEINEIWKVAKHVQSGPVEDYCTAHSVRMDFWEVMNFISYGPGQHFQEHADHGFSYSATVSLVAYPNEDYVGGELSFPKLGIKIKPKAGDLYIFPSSYIYSHIAMPVESGIKYSIVTMLDYNDNTHNDEYRALVDKRLGNDKNKGI